MMVYVVYGIILVVIIGGFIAYKIIRKRITKKIAAQQEVVNQHKQTVTIFVIEKKMAKISEAKLPKAVVDQIPAIYKLKKLPLVTAKVGQQIVTLISEDKIYSSIPEKKNVTIELAGIFIAGIKNSNNSAPKKKRR
ncbi:MAG TPA: hypothetical protein PKV85_00805 [Spirochaetota bacterium]|jgi:hypothetical protein|nr:hypothetical protein [Spirochaetota bacterium]